MTPAEQEEIEFCIAQIRAMSSSFENKRLPDFAVGAIDGWCNRLARLARDEAPDPRPAPPAPTTDAIA